MGLIRRICYRLTARKCKPFVSGRRSAELWAAEKQVCFFRPHDAALPCVLKYDPFVASAAREAFAVKVFKQRDGVFARDAREGFKGRNIYQAFRLMD